MTFHSNSRTATLAQMDIGESGWFQCPQMKPLSSFMNNLGVDMRRVEKRQPEVQFTQKKWIAVNPDTAETIVLVRVSKHERSKP